MLDQAAFLNKALVAVVAPEWLFACMDTAMHSQVAPVGEACAAVIAGMRLLAGVNESMPN